MTWKTLRDALEMAAACGFDVDGDAGAATPAVSRKSADPERPASVTEQQTHFPVAASKAHMRPALPEVSRRGYVTPQSGLPHPVAYPRLVIDNSGRNSRGDGLRETKLRLVSG